MLSGQTVTAGSGNTAGTSAHVHRATFGGKVIQKMYNGQRIGTLTFDTDAEVGRCTIIPILDAKH